MSVWQLQDRQLWSMAPHRQEYKKHVRCDVLARHLKDWRKAENHQASARQISEEFSTLFGARTAEVYLTYWRDEALAEARREIKTAG